MSIVSYLRPVLSLVRAQLLVDQRSARAPAVNAAIARLVAAVCNLCRWVFSPLFQLIFCLTLCHADLCHSWSWAYRREFRGKSNISDILSSQSRQSTKRQWKRRTEPIESVSYVVASCSGMFLDWMISIPTWIGPVFVYALHCYIISHTHDGFFNL